MSVFIHFLIYSLISLFTIHLFIIPLSIVHSSVLHLQLLLLVRTPPEVDGEESNDGVGLSLEERLRRKGISRTGDTPTTTKR